MRLAPLATLAFAGLLCACGPNEPAVPERPIPEDSLLQTPETPAPPELTTDAANTVEELRLIAERGQLVPLARRADEDPGFVSNFGSDTHYAHWDLLRRTGVDPNAKLLDLLEEPYARVQAGEQVWFIWPDFAARDAGDLIPEKLSFVDRARLLELVGDDGIAAIRRGRDYPGFRTAISEDGRWLYFTHEPQDADQTDGED